MEENWRSVRLVAMLSSSQKLQPQVDAEHARGTHGRAEAEFRATNPESAPPEPFLLLQYDGSKCNDKLNNVNANFIDEAEIVACGIEDKKYNASDAPQFYKEMQEQTYWKDINFVACHGGFIRNLVAHAMNVAGKDGGGTAQVQQDNSFPGKLVSTLDYRSFPPWNLYYVLDGTESKGYTVASYLRGSPDRKPPKYLISPYKTKKVKIPKEAAILKSLTTQEMTMLRLENIGKNNLFIVRMDVEKKAAATAAAPTLGAGHGGAAAPERRTFYMIRHCARQYQGSGWRGGERTTPDPQCARIGAGQKICDQDLFTLKIKNIIMEEHQRVPSALSQGESDPLTKTVGVFSSCMRRATETAKVVMDALEESSIVQSSDDISHKDERAKLEVEKKVRVVPFCRENKNFLGNFGADVLNTCSKTTMERVRTKKSCEMS